MYPCGSKFDIQHSVSCKKRGFVTIRQNNLRDRTAKILSEYATTKKNRAKTCPVKWKDLRNRTANRSNEARLDLQASGFWERGQQAFFDLRVFDPNACRYLNKSLQQCHVINENKEKMTYIERALPIDHGAFTVLVFSIYGKMGRECHKIYSRLLDLLSEKRYLSKSVVPDWAV